MILPTRRVALACLLVLAISSLAAADEPEANDIIKKEGQLLVTDGSSYYRFLKDGSFDSGPLGMSGRTIQGKWTMRDNFFVIDGNWGWINGVAPRVDHRRLTLSVQGPLTVMKDAAQKFAIVSRDKNPPKPYESYMVIDELVKLPAAKPAKPAKPGKDKTLKPDRTLPF